MSALNKSLIVILALAGGLACLDANNFVLVILIITLFVLSRVFRNIYPVIFFFIFCIPDEVLYYYSGSMPEYGFGWIRVHPIVPAVLVFSVWNIFSKIGAAAALLKNNRWMKANILILTAFITLSFFQTVALRGLQGLTVLLENYLAPMLLMFCAYVDFASMEKPEREKATGRTCRILVIMIFAAAVYGIAEYFLRNNIIYGKALGSLAFFKSITNMQLYRITSVFGHSLKNSYYYLFALNAGLALLAFPFNMIITAVNFIALLLTGSRAGFLLGVVSVLSLFLERNFGRAKKVALGIAAAALVILIVFKTPFADLVFYRMSTETMSTQIRIYSFLNLPALLGRYFFTGEGFGSSAELSRLFLPFGTSFENPWIMMLVDAGFIATFLYLFFIFRVIWASRKKIDYKVVIAGVLFMSLSSFSSHFRSTLNFLFLFNMAMIMAGNVKTGRAAR